MTLLMSRDGKWLSDHARRDPFHRSPSQSLSSCFQVYAASATIDSCAGLPVPAPPSASSAIPSTGDRRRDSRLPRSRGARSRSSSSSSPSHHMVLPAAAARLLLSSPFWVGRCGRILAVSACGLPQLSTVGREGRRERGHERSSSAVWRGWRRQWPSRRGRPRRLRRQWREGARPPTSVRPPIPTFFPSSPSSSFRVPTPPWTNNRFWPLLRVLRRVRRRRQRWHCHCPH